MKVKIASKFGIREIEGKKISIVVNEDNILTVKVNNKIVFADVIINVGNISFN